MRCSDDLKLLKRVPKEEEGSKAIWNFGEEEAEVFPSNEEVETADEDDRDPDCSPVEVPRLGRR